MDAVKHKLSINLNDVMIQDEWIINELHEFFMKRIDIKLILKAPETIICIIGVKLNENILSYIKTLHTSFW